MSGMEKAPAPREELKTTLVPQILGSKILRTGTSDTKLLRSWGNSWPPKGLHSGPRYPLEGLLRRTLLAPTQPRGIGILGQGQESAFLSGARTWR